MRYTLRQRLVSLPGGATARLPDGHEDGREETEGDSGGWDVPDAVDPTLVPLHIVRGWDEEERAGAWGEAQRAGDRDPDAAAYLIACLESDASAGDVSAQRSISPHRRTKPFDPMRMIARIAKFYGWSDADVRRTPWKTLLGYAREADLMTEEENKRYQDSQRGGAGRDGGATSVREWMPDELRRTTWAAQG